MLITIGRTNIETAKAIAEVMSDEQLESRILEVVNAELGYQNDRGLKSLAEKENAIDAEKYAAFLSARDTDTKAEILSKISVALKVVPITEEEVLP